MVPNDPSPSSLVPSRDTPFAGTIRFRADDPGDLGALAVGEVLDFVPVKVAYESDAPVSRLKTWGRLGGIVLALNFRGEGLHRIEGSAVIVAPGIALSASHVLRDYMPGFGDGSIKVLCVGDTEHGRSLWSLARVRFVPNTDICILSLVLVDGLPSDRKLRQASITTRTPKRGERLFFVGYKAEEEDCANWSEGQQIRTNVLVTAGKVTQHFVPMRDRVLLPGPSIEVDCPTWGGMSGGPVFDEQGWLIGVLSSGLDGGPSCLSMAVSALACPFIGGWPDPGSNVARSLLSMVGKGCLIERPEAVSASYPKSEDGVSMTEYVYSTWQTR